MYTRSFNDENSAMQIPSGYVGSAIKMPEPDVSEPAEDRDVFRDGADDDATPAGLNLGRRSGRGFSAFGDILSGLGLSMPKIGTEEIIILAIAAFLLFSKDGDKECAIMLLALLFIT